MVFTSRKVGLVVAATAVLLFFALLIVPSLLASYYRNQGINAYLNNDYEKAKILLEKSLGFSKKNPITYFYLGRVAIGRQEQSPPYNFPPSANDASKALEYFERAESLGIADANPDLYVYMLELEGIAYLILRNFDSAAEKWLKRIEVSPDNAFFPRYLLASEYYVKRQNKPKEALEVLTPAPRQVRSRASLYYLPDVYSYLARLEFYFGNFDDAIRYADLAVSKSGGSDTRFNVIYARIIRALSFAKKENVLRAEEEIKNTEKIVGEPGRFDCFLALAYSFAGQHRKAIEKAQAASNTKVVEHRMRCLLALRASHKALGNPAEAKKFSEEYVKLANELPRKDIFIWRNLQEEY